MRLPMAVFLMIVVVLAGLALSLSAPLVNIHQKNASAQQNILDVIAGKK